MTEVSVSTGILAGLLAYSAVILTLIRGTLLQVLLELRKRNYIQDLTNKVMMATPSASSEPTKTIPPSGISNPLDESEPPNASH